MPESGRLKVIVAYDGAPFAGWQSQSHGRTAQDEIERAFATLARRRLTVTGAGRTDAGAHALGQCFHVDVPKNLPAEGWKRALNGLLPPTIRILRARFVPGTFHARFSAKGKIYRYRIVNAEIMPPLELGRAWHVPFPFDQKLLFQSSCVFFGRHDFASFAANRGHLEKSTVRTIASVRVRHRANVIELEFAGDGFLYKMVRLMVGSVVRCAQGKESLSNLRARLENPSSTGQRFVAPADGLYLVRVRY